MWPWTTKRDRLSNDSNRSEAAAIFGSSVERRRSDGSPAADGAAVPDDGGEDEYSRESHAA